MAMVSFCSTSRMEMWRAAIFCSRPAMRSTICGASPSVGSSTMMRSGSPISVRQIVSICCSPPEITPAGVAAISSSLGNSR